MTTQPSPDSGVDAPTFALFAYGFRPFFFAAGAFAVLGLVAWLWLYTTGVQPLPNGPAQLWHGHEMLYGFVGAAIAGFLLTAVPSWTGARGFAGTPLILLATLWLAGRLAFAAASVLPVGLVALFDLAFMPALGGILVPPLVRARNRNSPLLVVLAGIWLTDVVFLYALMRDDPLLARTTLLVAIDIVLLLVTVIGGRIIPTFTANALPAPGPPSDTRTNRRADSMAIVAMIAVAVGDIVTPSYWLVGGIAAIAALAHVWRVGGGGGVQQPEAPHVGRPRT